MLNEWYRLCYDFSLSQIHEHFYKTKVITPSPEDRYKFLQATMVSHDLLVCHAVEVTSGEVKGHLYIEVREMSWR